jgi:protein involved in temperature-dependent protein secretion
MFRKGKALSVKGDYEEADEQLAAAGRLDPGIERDVAAARASNKQRQKQATEKQKREFRNFFGK